jgi:hypothetical protein
MPVVIQDFETLPPAEAGGGAGAGGKAPKSETAAMFAAARRLRVLGRRQARLRG